VKRTRGLWTSIGVVAVLTGASVVGLLSGGLRPMLGLDLQGGVAVILSAPAGTKPDVMQQALENIRRRVDQFGVGEPDIFLSGTTIEVQIPGAANSTVEQQAADLYCLVTTEGQSFGCANTRGDAQAALGGLEVTSMPSEACVVTRNDEEVGCFPSKIEADGAIASYTVSPQTSPTPSPPATVGPSTTASASGTPSPSAGPVPPASSYCLTDPDGAQPLCRDTKADAQTELNGLKSVVTSRTFCLSPSSVPPSVSPPSPSVSPSPSPSVGPSPSPSPSASPSPSGIEAFQKLDTKGADALPCDYESRELAVAALASVTVDHIETRSCVVSSVGEDLGCYLSLSAAQQRQRETGQQRLLDVIGTTARLEERPTISVISPQAPEFALVPVTCGTPEEQATLECKGGAQDGNEVVYLDESGNKVRLGPVILTGANVKRATAILGGGTQNDPIQQWKVTFDFDSEGARAFSDATTRAYVSPAPQNQIAIVVDRVIVSNPVVQEPITGGTGEITGGGAQGFDPQQAKDLATLLNAGSLPVELTRQSVRTVSPTLGSESLRQGIVAGIGGLILLFLYLVFYYRLLGLVAWLGMSIWAVLAVAMVSWAGKEYGYALTLAGVAGLVISLGVTADSYIVFFERLKDELRAGKSPRAVVQPAFKRAFRTIVAADIVTGIAAAVLYVTAVSSVRGFALTLGVATALDLTVVYFFKRPTVFLLARSKRLIHMRGFGLTAATAGDHGVAGEEASP
jgi:preprotein translocase subunit SecD